MVAHLYWSFWQWISMIYLCWKALTPSHRCSPELNHFSVMRLSRVNGSQFTHSQPLLNHLQHEDLFNHIQNEDLLNHLQHKDLLNHLQHKDLLNHLQHEDLFDHLQHLRQGTHYIPKKHTLKVTGAFKCPCSSFLYDYHHWAFQKYCYSVFFRYN